MCANHAGYLKFLVLKHFQNFMRLKILSVHNTMDRVREITKFFNYSQKEEQVLHKYVDLLKPKKFLCKKLHVCQPCWVSQILGLEKFSEFYEALVKTFAKIYHKEEGRFNWYSVKKRICFLTLITTFDFIVTMVVF